VSCYTKLS